ncbi:hypothetical protein AAMO2058_000384900 [Amorphochlora amoebiformis]|uniref:CS domain-containing protein n=1 Tax=Amorphochlora amoebiformis TaxID=1561963 RepID=A0A7S0DRI3_9EUKA|mmetsp:Transcript_4980/g.7567  ORF Transcript_4980/g.7567 Transcript_4980/m.7567 type:complete len:218 (+) Transcript_4980:73-726(+)
MLLELFAVIIASVRSEGTARDFHPRLSKGRRFGGPYVCGSAMSTLHRLRGAGMTSPWEDFEELTTPIGQYGSVYYMDAIPNEDADWTYEVMFIPLDDNPVIAKNVNVTIRRNWLFVSYQREGSSNATVLCDRQLHRTVTVEDSYWDVDRFFDARKGIRVCLRKEDATWIWVAGFKEEEIRKFGQKEADLFDGANVYRKPPLEPKKRTRYQKYRGVRR